MFRKILKTTEEILSNMKVKGKKRKKNPNFASNIIQDELEEKFHTTQERRPCTEYIIQITTFYLPG